LNGQPRKEEQSVTTSRIPGFRNLSVEERRATVAEQAGMDVAELEAFDADRFDIEAASHLSENVIGTFARAHDAELRQEGEKSVGPCAVVHQPGVRELECADLRGPLDCCQSSCAIILLRACPEQC
jgi:hypothetical protein